MTGVQTCALPIYVQFSSNNAMGAPGRNVTVSMSGTVVAGYPIDQAFIDRVNAGSGNIAMGDGTSSGNALDFTALSSSQPCFGAVGTATYMGVITPNSTNASVGYVLGGGGGTLILPIANTLTGGRTVTVGNNSYPWLPATRQGTVVVNNTNDFTGACTIRGNGSVLSTPFLADLNQPSGIGIWGALFLKDGALEYTGPGVSINRVFTLDNFGNGGTILANGSGPLKFTSTSGIGVSYSGYSQVLGLGGTNTGDNTFGLSMADSSGSAAKNSLVKFGSGTWVMTNTYPYSGATTVSGGVLRVNGILTTSSVAVVGGTLAGIGTISNSVTVAGATLAPGNPTGTLKTGAVTLNSASTFAVTLNGTNSGQFSQLQATNGVALGGASLTITLGYTPRSGDRFRIINNLGSGAPGTFGTIPAHVSYAEGDYVFSVNYAAGDGNDVELSVGTRGGTLLTIW